MKQKIKLQNMWEGLVEVFLKEPGRKSGRREEINLKTYMPHYILYIFEMNDGPL